MKISTKCLLSLAAFVLVAVSVLAACSKTPSDPYVVMENLPYVPGSVSPYQQLDLYLPGASDSPKKSNPVIVIIHGGAWMSGDKNHPPAIKLLIRHGYAIASINYRLTGQFTHPAQINDCKAAIRYLRAHAREYGLDPERIGVWGQSAGGHLAALLGTSGDVKELEGNLGNENFSSKVQAVVDWCGPSDLLSIASQAKPNCKINFRSPNNPVAALMGPSVSPAGYLTASPVQYIDKDDPPFLIIHAKDDDIVPVEQSQELVTYLEKAGVECESRLPLGGGHSLGHGDFIDETVRFFDKHLYGAKRQ